jgi:hypothetical protein
MHFFDLVVLCCFSENDIEREKKTSRRFSRSLSQPPPLIFSLPSLSPQQPAVDYDALATKLDRASPLEIVDFALETFGDGIGIAFSGAEDVALVEYAHLMGRPYRVFSLDTGRLNPETYRLFDAVEKHYGIK